MEFEVEILDDIYEVDRILDAKRKDGKMYYKVRWEGYGSEEDSWEPMDNLLTCQELVDRYWVQKKEGYKKRGRKPKRHKEATEEETDGSDMEGGQKDENEEETEMTLQPPKSKRGRPPKQQIVSDTSSQDQSPDRGSSSSPEDENEEPRETTLQPPKRKRGRPPKQQIVSDTSSQEESPHRGTSNSPEFSDQNAAKKRRVRPIKEEEFSSRICDQFLLLDHEIAPLGMTRQASKELALVSLRKKQERETLTSCKAEVRTATASEEAVSSEMNQDGYNGSESQDYFEVIEISSQSSNEDEEQMISSQELEPMVKEYIEISSQDESEGEEISAKQFQDLSKKKMDDRNGKEMSLTVEAENEKTDKIADSGVHKTGLPKVKRTFAEDHSAENSHSSSSDPFPPIDFSFESNTALAEDKREKGASGNAEEIPEAFLTDENSNQVMSSSSSVPPKAGVTTKFSVSKIQSLFKKSAQESNSGSFENNSEQKSIKNVLVTSVNNLNVPVTSVSLKNSRTQVLSSTSEPGRRVLEPNDHRGVHNDVETVAARKSVAMHALQMVSQDDTGTSKRRSEKIGERSFTGKARRTEGRPKSIRDLKKRLSLDSSLALQQNSSVTAKPGVAENSSMGINEAFGKPEKQVIVSTTADLLPMRNKTSSVPLMDGDLLGTIIQDSGKIDDSKTKPQTGTQAAARKEGISQKKANDEREKLKPWDSGMEDISDGEDDLSDFEFDLDDYSPHSFFDDVKEPNLSERTPSPVVEPLNLSLVALKQAIREGNIIQVRRALSVPGLNPDTIDTASGMSLLMWAATYGQDDIVKLLLRRGAGVNYTDQKRNAVTALMHAAEQGFPETVQILLESGAHINCQTTAGETALMRACKKGHREVVEILLRNGVDTKAQSNHELTAVQIALKNQHFEIQNLLSDHEESLASSLQIALGKCLGTAGTLRLPLLMPYRCIAPGERESNVFDIKYDSSKVPQGSKVVLFCVRADFNGDEVCFSFGGDNGVRTVLFNGSIQYPLVQGNRSVFLLTPDAEVSTNVLTVKTHTMKTARLIVCVGNVSAANEIS